jgi:hypothetical protein
MNTPEEEGGWHYSTRLSHIEEKFGRPGGGGAVCNSTRARVPPLFEVRWLGQGLAYL